MENKRLIKTSIFLLCVLLLMIFAATLIYLPQETTVAEMTSTLNIETTHTGKNTNSYFVFCNDYSAEGYNNVQNYFSGTITQSGVSSYELTIKCSSTSAISSSNNGDYYYSSDYKVSASSSDEKALIMVWGSDNSNDYIGLSNYADQSSKNLKGTVITSDKTITRGGASSATIKFNSTYKYIWYQVIYQWCGTIDHSNSYLVAGQSAKFTADQTAPTLSSSIASGGYTNRKVSVKATDNASGFDKLYYKTPGSGSYSFQTTATFTIGNAGEGTYSFYAVDKVGNQSATYTIFYDETIPTITSSPSVSSGSFINYRITIQSSDNGSGFDKLYYKTPGESSYSSTAINDFVVGNKGEGNYSFYAVDKAGNHSATFSVYYDSAAPTISSSVTSGSYTNKKIIINSSDSGSGFDKLYYKTPGMGNYSFQTTATYTIGNAGDGGYVFYVVDKAGNRSAYYTIYYDSKAPSLSSSVASGGYTNQKVSITASDSGSGFATLYFKTPGSGSYSSQTMSTFTIGNAGEGTYSFYAVDKVGNQSATYTINYDVTLPTLSSSVASGGYTNQKVSITASDSASGFAMLYYKTPGASSYSSQTTATFTIGNAGEGTYSFYALDNAGNRSATYTINYDVTLPTLSSSVASGGYTNQKVSITASDSASGFAMLYYKTPGASSYSSQTTATFTIGNAGEGTYSFYALDNAGNRSATYTINYDVTLPTVGIRNATGTSIVTNGFSNSGVYFDISDTNQITSSKLFKFENDEWKLLITDLINQSVFTNTTVYYDANLPETERIYYATKTAAGNAIFSYINNYEAYSDYTSEAATGCIIPDNQIDLAVDGVEYYKFSYEGSVYLYFSSNDLENFIMTLATARVASSSKELYSDGDAYYKIEVEDVAGNVTIKTFTIDTVEPVAELEGYDRLYDETPIIGANHLMKLNASDANLFSISINGNVFELTEAIEYELDPSCFNEGLNKLLISDAAGNVMSLSFYYDTKSPIITANWNGITLSEGDIVSGKKSKISISVKDSYFYEVRIRDSVLTSNTTSVDVATWQDGALIIIAEDYAGNKTSISLYLDNSTPELIFDGYTTKNEGNVYSNRSVAVSVNDISDIDLMISLDGKQYVAFDGVIEGNGTYYVYAVDQASNESQIYTVLISVIDDFGNEYSIKNGYKVNSFYVVTLPSKVFATSGKENIAGKYSFRTYDAALSWAISKEYEYRVSVTSEGWLYVSASKESVAQIYDDYDTLMTVVQSYASAYVNADRTVVNAANTTSYNTIMSESGQADETAFTEQNVILPSYLSEYSEYNVYLIDLDYIYNPVKLDYGTFTGKIRYTYIANDVAIVDKVIYEFDYGLSVGVGIGAEILNQGYYLVEEFDLCGNVQTYLVYIDVEAPTVSVNVEFGDGTSKILTVNQTYVNEFGTTMYYMSLDLNNVFDNIDEFYVLTISCGSFSQTYLQGDELPTINAETFTSGAWTISVYDRSGNTLSFTVYIAGTSPSWTYSSLSSLKSVTFTFKTSENYNSFTNIEIFKILADGTYVKQDVDSNNTPITPSTTSYVFTEGGKFAARITDLFGRVVELGPVFFLKGLPTGTLKNVSDGGVTNQDVSFVYSDAYSLIAYVFEEGEWLEYPTDRYTVEYSASTAKYTAVFVANETTCYDYKLFLYNTENDTLFIEYTFRIDCVLADFYIVNADGKSIDADGSTNKSFCLTWDETDVTVKYSKVGMFETVYKKGTYLTGDGTYYFTIKDYAGNTLSFTVLLDTKVSFSISGTYKEVNGIYYTSKPVTVSVSELYKSFDCTSDNDIAVLPGAAITYDGHYHIKIVDYYDNVVEFDIVIDTIAPTFELAGVENGGTGSSDVRLSWDESDVATSYRVDKYKNVISEAANKATYSDEGAYYFLLSDLTGNSTFISFNIDKSVDSTSSVLDGQITTEVVTLTFNEEVELEITKDGELVEDPVLKISDVGTYKVEAKDVYGNVFELSFTIIAPLYQIFTYDFSDSDVVSVMLNDVDVEFEVVEGILTLTQSGDYVLTMSNANNEAYTLKLTVDNVAPTVDIIQNEDGSVTIDNASKEDVAIVLYKDGVAVDYKLGQDLSEKGQYKLVISDGLGNQSEYTFEIKYKFSTVSIIIIVVAAVAAIAMIILIIVKRKVKA